jgi:hypothetical protein
MSAGLPPQPPEDPGHGAQPSRVQDAGPQGTSARRGRIPPGSWYFVIPILTLGWLSAIPFVHAGLRLRDRKVLLLAGMYAAGGAVAYILLSKAKVDARGGVSWPGPAGLLLGVFLAGLACFQLFTLRLRVYPVLQSRFVT